MKRRTRIISAAAVAGVLVLGAVFIATGAYNVAATAQHTPIVHWLLNTTMERSVAVRARSVPDPPRSDSAMMMHGAEHYHAMCATCHGAPGMARSEIGRGMNPKPPDLAKTAAEWTDRELFWIVRHGIKLAGMPGFGSTHSDEELWGIVAFVRRLQDMPPEEYQRYASAAGGHGETAGVDHAHGASLARAADGAAPAEELMHGMEHGAVAADGRRDAATVRAQRSAPATGHAHAVVAAQPSGAQGSVRRMEGMDHTAAQRRAVETDEHATHAAQADAETTAKLKALVTELLRDQFVRDRINADSALRRRWQNDKVRKQLIGPQQSSHQ